MRKNILILEDHLAQLQALSNIVQEVSSEIQIFGAQTVPEALEAVFYNHIDIFIIDIIIVPNEPGDTSGLKFVEKIRNMEEYAFTPVIFTTSLEDPQIFAYKKLNCIEYIEKPYEKKRIKEVVKHCLSFPGNKDDSRQIIFREDGILWPINISQILFIETLNHRVYVYETKGEQHHFSYRTVKSILSEVKDSSLIQCNRSVLVNREYIRNIDLVNGFIELREYCNKINIGSTFRRKLKEAFKTEPTFS